jgi:hypothetical protein
VISVFSNKISKYIEKKKYKLCLLIINHLDSVVKINLFHVNNLFFFNLAEILMVERSGGLLFLQMLIYLYNIHRSFAVKLLKLRKK